MEAPLIALASSLAITLAMLIIALVSWLRMRRFVHAAARATGTVIGYDGTNRKRNAANRPLVRFATDAGAPIEFRDFWGGEAPRFPLGAQVPVLYDPRDPARARIFTKASDLYFIPMLLGGLGGLFAVLMCAMAALMVVVFRMADAPL
ncbi:MAG TPA: DUF3592 domain-containing protein [Herpetosiphonaceae bacterium]